MRTTTPPLTTLRRPRIHLPRPALLVPEVVAVAVAVADALQAEAADFRQALVEAMEEAAVAAAVVAAIAQQTRLAQRSVKRLSLRGQSPLAARCWQGDGRISCIPQLPPSAEKAKLVHGG